MTRTSSPIKHEPMIKSYWKLFLPLALMVSGPLKDVDAVGVGYDGYFRFRQNFNHNLNMDRDQSPNWRNYSDFRFRLNPTFYVTDGIRIHSSLNFIDGVFGDRAMRSFAYGNPAQRNDFQFNDGSSTTIGRTTPQADQSSWVYGGAYGPEGASRTTDVQAIQLRRAWAEVETNAGLIKVGRMPVHIGLGIYANAGDEIDQQIGTTRDRVQFETTFGNYFIKPGFSWFYEGLLDDGSGDAYEYFFELGRNTEYQSLGLHVALLKQGRGTTTGSESFEEKTNYWVIDLYGRRKFDQLTAETEVALFTGTWLGKSLFAVNGAARLSFEKRKWNWRIESGVSTGTSDNDANANKVRSYAFNRDYNIAMIVFNEALPGGSSLPGEAADEERPVAPHSGTITNAIYAKTAFEFDLSKYFKPEVHFILPFALERSGQAGGKFYGFEYDIISKWPINDYTTGLLSIGHFLPGNFYNNVAKPHSVVLVRAGLNVEF